MEYVNHHTNDHQFRCQSDCTEYWATKRRSEYVEGNLWPFGIEKTFVFHDWRQGTATEYDNKIETRIEKIVDKITDSQEINHFYNVHNDPGCLEMSSLPLRSMKKAKDFFDKATSIALRHRMRHHSDSICGTGGHIHIERPSDEKAVWALHKLAVTHPGLGLFASPHDDMNSSSFGLAFVKTLNDSLEYEYEDEYYREVFKPDFRETVANFGILAGLLDLNLSTITDPGEAAGDSVMFFRETEELSTSFYKTILTPQNYTLEFRCFDVTKNWAEQKLHIEFVQAFVKYALSNIEKLNEIKFDPIELVDAVRMSSDELVDDFRDLIETIGLNPEDYVHYEKNAEMRSLNERMALQKYEDEYAAKVDDFINREKVKEEIDWL